jgi:mono/diheme cytochrome c family protein
MPAMRTALAVLLGFALGVAAPGAQAPAASTGAQAPDARQVAKGKEVFTRMKCLLCHKLGDKGGALAPDLDGVALRRDAASLRRLLEDPEKEMKDPQYKVKMPVFPFKDGELDALVAYLGTLK